jgi:hypothetical protein
VTPSGSLIPARVVEARWLTRLQPADENVEVVLETRSNPLDKVNRT